jgi:hypothetical protein
MLWLNFGKTAGSGFMFTGPFVQQSAHIATSTAMSDLPSIRQNGQTPLRRKS